VNKERLIPVRSEAEIRVGAIYVLRYCKVCEVDHRFLVLRFLGEMEWDQGSALTWDTTLSCSGHDSPTWFSAWLAIPEGRLFLVEDGLRQEETPYVTRVRRDA
jgi:hypothetical protein